MRAWRLLAAVVTVLAASPAAAAPAMALRAEQEAGQRSVLERVRATISAEPLGAGPMPAGLRVTTSIGGPAPRERMEGRLETRTSLASPQLGCWHAWSRGFFLGLELGWAVASSAPARGDASDRRGGGFAGLARPTTSLLHLGWSR